MLLSKKRKPKGKATTMEGNLAAENLNNYSGKTPCQQNSLPAKLVSVCNCTHRSHVHIYCPHFPIMRSPLEERFCPSFPLAPIGGAGCLELVKDKLIKVNHGDLQVV